MRLEVNIIGNQINTCKTEIEESSYCADNEAAKNTEEILHCIVIWKKFYAQPRTKEDDAECNGGMKTQPPLIAM